MQWIKRLNKIISRGILVYWMLVQLFATALYLCFISFVVLKCLKSFLSEHHFYHTVPWFYCFFPIRYDRGLEGERDVEILFLMTNSVYQSSNFLSSRNLFLLQTALMKKRLLSTKFTMCNFFTSLLEASACFSLIFTGSV